MGQAERKAKTGGGCKTHGVLQVEKIGTVAERLELGGERAHDGDDQAFLEVGIDGAKAIEAKHHSSHIKSRVRRRATGWRLLSARVWASPIRFSTEAGASR